MSIELEYGTEGAIIRAHSGESRGLKTQSRELK